MSKRLLFSAIVATIMMSATAVYTDTQSRDNETAKSAIIALG